MSAVDKEVTDLVFHGRPPAKEWPWTPSGNIRQAMIVADEIMRTRKLNFKLDRHVEVVGHELPDPRWRCTFSAVLRPPSRGCSIYEADADSPQAAICMAAVKVMRKSGKHIRL